MLPEIEAQKQQQKMASIEMFVKTSAACQRVFRCPDGEVVMTATGPNLQPGGSEFLNWENLAVHPLDLTPDGATLLVCNPADHRLEIFDVSSGTPAPAGGSPWHAD